LRIPGDAQCVGQGTAPCSLSVGQMLLQCVPFGNVEHQFVHEA